MKIFPKIIADLGKSFGKAVVDFIRYPTPLEYNFEQLLKGHHDTRDTALLMKKTIPLIESIKDPEEKKAKIGRLLAIMDERLRPPYDFPNVEALQYHESDTHFAIAIGHSLYQLREDGKVGEETMRLFPVGPRPKAAPGASPP